MSGLGKRGAAAVLASGLLLTGLAACSSTDKVPTKVVTTKTAAGPALLTFSVYGPPPVVTAYARIAADFTAQHPDIVVNVRPYDSHAQSDRALKSEAGSREPDVFLADRSDLAFLTQDDRIQPVDALLGDRGVDFGDGFQREALEAFSGDSALQCMPVDTSPLVVYYNTRLVDLAALTEPGQAPVSATTGWTLDEFAAAARQASHGPVRGVYVAPTLEQIAPFVWSGGGDVVDSVTEPTTLELSSSDSEHALEKALEVLRDPSITPSEKQARRLSAVARFKEGRLAMMLGYRELTPALRATPGLSFDVMPLPRQSQRATSGTMRGLCISGSTDHAGKAADFIAYAVGDEATTTLTETGYVTPTNLDVSNSDTFLQPGRMPDNPQVFTRAVRYIQRLPVGAAWDRVRAATNPMLQRLLYDPVIDPLEDRLKAIDERSAELLAPTPTPSPTTSASPTS